MSSSLIRGSKGKEKMLYSVTATGRVFITKVVEASSQQEAQQIADGMKSLVDAASRRGDLEVSSYASVSDENFRYYRGAFYLVKRYSSEVVAKCIRSSRRGITWEHHFEYQDTGNRFILRYRQFATRRRVIRLLCEDQKLGDHCDSCPSKFVCFTSRKDK